ncbi:DarT1-associated NADAR antitoxin family protein [Aureimonas mangrovi]|uniref:DarT1-associated NADAR antitoxin family protein n=1 Tax=Aureimonas mangrovi TaxID=2758041 RepID=UPI00163D7C87|nr:hypothetical protein [Aureimonas mangrovi]
MAQRPVYIPRFTGPSLVLTRVADFQWYPGLSISQKQKSIASLHASAREQLGVENALEISSKSSVPYGVAASAFNLAVAVGSHPAMIVECAFQGSKVFQKGGPFTDLYTAGPRDAKRDERLRSSGRLTAFRLAGVDWAIDPQTAFYDWLYVSAMGQSRQLGDELMAFDAFTDIEFNPEKSINCQAYSAALYVSLRRRGLLGSETLSRDAFLQLIDRRPVSNARQQGEVQGSLF